MTDTWNAAQYLRFADERTRPCRDLAARIALSPGTAADLGCGPGNSTAVLAERWPEAAVTGIDSSSEMLARARRDHPAIRWEEADIATWPDADRNPGRTYDLVFSNAALQWVPDHAALLPRLFSRVAEGGALAAQVPADIEAPAHRLMRELAATERWRRFFPEPPREWHVHAPEFYYDVLASHAERLDLWASDYFHVMEGAAAIAEWYRGTGLRPFLDALPDAAERERFAADYAALLPREFPARADGKVLFPFRRLFLIAYR